jgi:myo-inositol-1-phosphate synthase
MPSAYQMPFVGESPAGGRQIYAYAALKMGVPFANGAPNLTTDTPALLDLARENNIPVCGKDFKTGQTFMKTLLAPGFKARMLGMRGWFSTNILGNRDGEVLEDPGSFKSKEVSRARHFHSAHEAEEYAALDEGRGFDHAPGAGILRLSGEGPR